MYEVSYDETLLRFSDFIDEAFEHNFGAGNNVRNGCIFMTVRGPSVDDYHSKSYDVVVKPEILEKIKYQFGYPLSYIEVVPLHTGGLRLFFSTKAGNGFSFTNKMNDLFKELDVSYLIKRPIDTVAATEESKLIISDEAIVISGPLLGVEESSPVTSLEEFNEIFEKHSDDSKWEGDNCVQSILILMKYIDPTKNSIIDGADHDEVYLCDINTLVKAGITRADVKALALLNLIINDEALGCYV